MKLKSARYALEHKTLPLFYFENKKEFISLLLGSEGELIYDIMDDFCDKIGCENLYKKEDYKVDFINVDEKARVVRVTMPEPREALECKYVYFVFDLEFEKMYYFTVEKTSIQREYSIIRTLRQFFNTIFKEDLENYLLCGRDEKGNHFSYGDCSADLNKQLEKTIQIYMG